MTRRKTYKLAVLTILLLLLIAGIAQHGRIAQAASNFYAEWGVPVVLQPHDGAVTSIAFSPDNRWLATGGEDGETHLWQLNQQATYEAEFVRLAPDASDPNGHNAKEHCGGDFQDANAEISIQQEGDASTVQIKVSNARPETLYTTWLRVKGKTQGDAGVEYGGSPLTGAGSTPLAPSSAIENLAAITETPGSTEVANGLWTDANGDGVLVAELDFPILGGAYPFHRYDASLAPLAIVGAPFAPFMIRIASHCTDEMGHGLKAGSREPWFDWSS